MKFVLQFDMDDAAFCDNDGEVDLEFALHEAAVILNQALAQMMRFGLREGDTHSLRDTNGNTVGGWEVTS